MLTPRYKILTPMYEILNPGHEILKPRSIFASEVNILCDTSIPPARVAGEIFRKNCDQGCFIDRYIHPLCIPSFLKFNCAFYMYHGRS